MYFSCFWRVLPGFLRERKFYNFSAERCPNLQCILWNILTIRWNCLIGLHLRNGYSQLRSICKVRLEAGRYNSFVRLFKYSLIRSISPIKIRTAIFVVKMWTSKSGHIFLSKKWMLEVRFDVSSTSPSHIKNCWKVFIEGLICSCCKRKDIDFPFDLWHVTAGIDENSFAFWGFNGVQESPTDWMNSWPIKTLKIYTANVLLLSYWLFELFLQLQLFASTVDWMWNTISFRASDSSNSCCLSPTSSWTTSVTNCQMQRCFQCACTRSSCYV